MKAVPSDEFSQHFLAAIARRELRYPRDPVTGAPLGLRQRVCENGEPAWALASGDATVLSFTIYHQMYSEEFNVPYNVALIALEEGPTLISTVHAPIDGLRTGLAVRAAFDEDGRLVFVPRIPSD